MPERRIFGEFELIRMIGHGGMGEIYEAWQPSLERRVAIKLLPHRYRHDEALRERLFREARAAAKIHSPYVVEVLTLGVHENIPWVAMEYITGKDFARQRKSGATYNLKTALTWLKQIAWALDAAHQEGIIHRDIKASNIMLKPDGNIKVTDFGLARHVDDETLTQSGMLLGSLHTMSPEQAEGRPLDHRCDLYSFGVVAYELIEGDVPYVGSRPSQIINGHLHGTIPSLSQKHTDFPRGVDALVRTCLAKKPEDRFASASELASTIEDLIKALPDKSLQWSLPFIKQNPEHIPETLTVDKDQVKPDPKKRQYERSRRHFRLALISLIALTIVTHFVVNESKTQNPLPLDMPVQRNKRMVPLLAFSQNLPAETELWLDGEFIGHCPLSENREVTFGEHNLVIKQKWKKDETITILVDLLELSPDLKALTIDLQPDMKAIENEAAQRLVQGQSPADLIAWLQTVVGPTVPKPIATWIESENLFRQAKQLRRENKYIKAAALLNSISDQDTIPGDQRISRLAAFVNIYNQSDNTTLKRYLEDMDTARSKGRFDTAEDILETIKLILFDQKQLDHFTQQINQGRLLVEACEQAMSAQDRVALEKALLDLKSVVPQHPKQTDWEKALANLQSAHAQQVERKQALAKILKIKNEQPGDLIAREEAIAHLATLDQNHESLATLRQELIFDQVQAFFKLLDEALQANRPETLSGLMVSGDIRDVTHRRFQSMVAQGIDIKQSQHKIDPDSFQQSYAHYLKASPHHQFLKLRCQWHTVIEMEGIQPRALMGQDHLASQLSYDLVMEDQTWKIKTIHVLPKENSK